ncbi:hypothetical protein PC9H_003013 [Pleurotus ostreatus]|uniref:RCC1-like domain-containing protein n=2 Tax=Pleurotus ostreatus TaxID=5322 RepID=A0A067NU52_PLEO1|nr:uncharacterized protein PC9H_003013 [Pleurotus ostreatus]KAF7436187.1 hypothetical protein PC9H_003013 [Pleurotus ostreatus]KAJ8701833.1 alpha tubulin suppressor [Pleurotus ostreatus]KDQ31429.1 hypothetical protein PLEOSDRAFT_1075510 [Pleurotus ostreatus PC15]
MSSPTPIVYSAGSNARGQLASGNCDDLHSFDICQFTSEDLTNSIQDIVSISGGANHTVVLLRTQSLVELWGCGDGGKGQLGPSYHQNILEESAKSRLQLLDIPSQHSALRNASPRLVAAAWETTYIVFTTSSGNDVLVSLGANDYGDLGVGTTSDSINMISFAGIFSPLDLVRLRIEDLATGPHHVIVYLLATLSDGSERRVVAGWGAARHGQLGEINASDGKIQPIQATPRLILDLGEMDHVASIGVGNQHSVILLRSGRIHAFGSDRKNQLAGVQSLVNIQRVVCTWNNTYAVRADKILSVGNNAKGQLGRLTHDPNLPAAVQLSGGEVKNIACGSEHVLVWLETGDGSEVWGWGWNEHGNIGIGSTDDVMFPVKIWPTSKFVSAQVVGIWAGCGTSWIAVRK